MTQITKTKTFCELPFNKMLINQYGEVFSCCHQDKPFGNIIQENTDIVEIWNRIIQKEIRKSTQEGQLHSACSQKNCPFISKKMKRNMFDAVHYDNFQYPLHIEFSLPDEHCNIGGTNPTKENPACLMCRRNFFINRVSPEWEGIICDKIKPLIPYLKIFEILGTAEPFWKNKCFEILDKVNFHQYKDQIKFKTNTNGLCLTQKVIDTLLETVALSDISISIDAATPETYKKLRRVDSFQFLLKNIENLIRRINELNLQDNHSISVYNNINMINVHEMASMVKVYAATGIKNMFFMPTHDHGGTIDINDILINKNNEYFFINNAKEAIEEAKRNNVSLKIMPATDSIRKLVQIEF